MVLNGLHVETLALAKYAPLTDVINQLALRFSLQYYSFKILLKAGEYFGIKRKPVLTVDQGSPSEEGLRVVSEIFTQEGMKQLKLTADNIGHIELDKSKSSGMV